MSDFGGSQGRRFTDAELEAESCGRGDACYCTGRTCRLIRELRERRAADLSSRQIAALQWLREQVANSGNWFRGQRVSVEEALGALDCLLAAHGAQ